MITSHCQTCGNAKDSATITKEFREGAQAECTECQQRRNGLREFVTRENAEIEKKNTERVTRGEVPLSLLDASSIIREGMVSRVLPVMGHMDPRTGFNPGLVDPRMAGLGMGSKVPANATIDVTSRDGSRTDTPVDKP
jgi:hypothetical protein